MRKWNNSLIYLLAFLVLAAASQSLPLWGREVSAWVRARRIEASVQRLAELENWDEARRLLDVELSRSEGGASRIVLNFNLGYLLEQMAKVAPRERERELLQESTKAYRTVLLEDFDNPQAIVNPSDWKSKVAHTRLISIYAGLDDTPLSLHENMHSYCVSLNNRGFSQLARLGWERVIWRTYNRSQSISEKALYSLTQVEAQQDTLTANSLAGLPDAETWDSEALKELRIMVTADQVAPSTLGWWSSESDRRHLAAHILTNRSDQLIRQGRPSQARDLYQAAIDIAPRIEAYVEEEPLKGQKPAKLEAALGRARVFLLFPELDPQGHRFRETVNVLFDEKAFTIFERNLPLRQRYHRTLGIIYAGRGEWGKVDVVESAIFQLDMALKIEDIISEERNVPPRSLPELHRLLAKGYSHTNEPEKAARHTIDATKGYISMRDLRTANKTLEWGKTTLIPRLSGNKRQIFEADSVKLRSDIDTQQRLRKVPRG